jgi:hypothetical protein
MEKQRQTGTERPVETIAKPDPGDFSALLQRPRATEPEEIRVGSLVKVVNVAPHKLVNPWLTPRHLFRVQLIDRISETPLLVLIDVPGGETIAAPLADCALVGGAP